MPPDHVVIGYVHGGTVRAEFCASLLSVMTDGATPVDAVLTLESGPNISTARNKVCEKFLRDHSAPWLFMCDTDMVFHATALDGLLEVADPVTHPVVGALCYSLEAGRQLPTMYELTEDGSRDRLSFRRHETWPEGAVVRVSATGAAALLIHRDALKTCRKRSADEAAPWFRESAFGVPLALLGEDLTFCLRLAAAGIPVHVATGVRAGHMKTSMLI
jgi:GT2 family glycosyltransferase